MILVFAAPAACGGTDGQMDGCELGHIYVRQSKASRDEEERAWEGTLRHPEEVPGT